MRRPRGQLRIIGGDWRSRRIAIAEDAALRPTPDRVRQTVFDWLTPLIAGARVLDAFAGSGALGLEALSRGAAHCTFVDASPASLAVLGDNLQRLQAGSRARCITGDALAWLRDDDQRYDVVFVDPPYASHLLDATLALLPPRLSATHRVYLEWSRGGAVSLPPGWALLREKSAGQVSYGLATYTAVEPGEP